MKKILALISLLTATPVLAQAPIDECEKASELRFISAGDSVAQLIARAGEPDYRDTTEYRENDTYSYFPACGNQTIFNFKIRNGRVVQVERVLQH